MCLLRCCGRNRLIKPRCHHFPTPLQHDMTVALLWELPPTVRWLDLDVKLCAGPLLPALARFRHLQRLTIGNGAGIEWHIGPPAALAPLRQLCLDYRRPPMPLDNRYTQLSIVGRLPASAAAALVAATALHTLELRLEWSDAVAALCYGLPALRQLRWAGALCSAVRIRYVGRCASSHANLHPFAPLHGHMECLQAAFVLLHP